VVRPGAQVLIEGSHIGGAISANGPAFFGLCDSTVGGSVSVNNATGFVLIGDPSDDGCGGNTITRSVVLRDNHHAVEVAANHIQEDLAVDGTSGTGPFPEDVGAEIEGNVIGGVLDCRNNAPAPTNDGQPNSVSGTRAGQCSGL
jgi:hypothetical protein